MAQGRPLHLLGGGWHRSRGQQGHGTIGPAAPIGGVTLFAAV